MPWIIVVLGCLMAGVAAGSQGPAGAQRGAPPPDDPAPGRRPGPQRRGPAPPTIPINEDARRRGAELFASGCAVCHGETGRGDGPGAASLSARPADQSDVRHMDRLTDVDLANKIRFGGFEMPAFSSIGGDDLVALVAYVRGLSRSPVRAVELYGLIQEEVRDFVPVTEDMLRNPDEADWPMFRRTYDAWAYSPLGAVNQRNVDRLQLAWSRAMGAGGQYGTPLVYRGVMYLANPGDVIQALHASNGDLIWEFRWDGPPRPSTTRRIAEGGERPQRGRSVRNLAIYQDKIFHLTRDAHIVAIDARSGNLVWHTKELERGIGHMAGPIIADGKVISGRSCAATAGPEACYIAAHDVKTGREVWRVRTIPRPGEPGDETWGGLPYEKRTHVGAWAPGSYDPVLNLIYWGTSVPAPSLEVLRGTPGQDVLYSNSTLAIDANDGSIAWHYQHLPRDNWDLDHVFERILVDTAVAPDRSEVHWINPEIRPGERRHVVTGIPGKTGIVYTLDRKTGKFLWARETIHQNVISHIDPRSGHVSINEALVVGPFVESLVCPSLGGGKDWPAGAYSPRTGLLYQPQQNMCMVLTGHTDRPVPADGYATSWVMVEDPTVGQPYMVGRVDAVSVETGRRAWLHRQRAGMIGSLVATAGGLVFGGDVNRRFMAFDDTTGAVLWESILSGPVSGHAISYAVDGEQYIAVPAGGDTASPEKRVLSLHPEIRPPQGINAIFVFKLGAATATPRLNAASIWRYGLVALASAGLALLAGRARSRPVGHGRRGRLD